MVLDESFVFALCYERIQNISTFPDFDAKMLEARADAWGWAELLGPPVGDCQALGLPGAHSLGAPNQHLETYHLSPTGTRAHTRICTPHHPHHIHMYMHVDTHFFQ